MLTTLLEKLLTLEQMLGTKDSQAIHMLLLEAQADVLSVDRERTELMEENARLREICALGTPSELCRICPFCRTGVRAWATPAEA